MSSVSSTIECEPLISEKPVVTVAHVRVVNGQGGGPDKTILNSPRFLDGHGYRAICAYMHPPDDAGFEQLRRKAAAWKAPLISLPDRGLRDIGILRRLLRVCREHRVDIWHAHDYKSNLFGLMLRPFWPMKLVTTVHGWVSSAGKIPLYYRIDRHLLKYYQRVICVSEDLMQECADWKVPKDRCVLVHNAIDTDEFPFGGDKRAAKLNAGIDPNRFIIGAVGRLAPEKAFDLLVHAVDRLLGDGHNVGLVIVGEGEERKNLESLISRLGRCDQIKLLGYQPDVVQYYQLMDAYALSSLREGLPNVLLEALATGVPIVATRIAGVPKLIQDEATGLLIDSGSVEELAGALRRLIVDDELGRRLSIAGRRVATERFSFAVRMEKVRAIYDELLSIKSTTRLHGR